MDHSVEDHLLVISSKLGHFILYDNNDIRFFIVSTCSLMTPWCIVYEWYEAILSPYLSHVSKVINLHWATLVSDFDGVSKVVVSRCSGVSNKLLSSVEHD